MRLQRVAIDGFRGFTSAVDIDMDADVIVIVAENGRGKTSLLDAILWALIGRVTRIAVGDAELISMYSATGSMSVHLELRDERNARTLSVTRTFDGVTTTLQVEEGGSPPVRGASATAVLIDALWPQAASAADSVGALERAVTSSVYLQQDLLKQFIEDDDAEGRYSTIAELLGGGRVTDVQVALERAKQAYAAATTRLENASKPLRARVVDLVAELSTLDNISPTAEASAAEAWERVQRLATAAGLDEVGRPSESGPGSLDGLIRQVQIQLQVVRQRQDSVEHLRELVRRQAVAPHPALDRTHVDLLETKLNDDEAALDTLQANARLLLAERKAEVSAHERQRELAQLALEFIDAECPVCGQDHDHETTRRRLRAMLSTSTEPTASSALSLVQGQISALEARIETQRREWARAVGSLEDADENVAARVRRANEINELVAALELALEAEPTLDSVEKASDELSRRQSVLFELLTSAEQFGMHARLTEQLAGRVRVENELYEARSALDRDEREQVVRRRALDLAGELVPQLRAAGDIFVETQLRELAPVFQRIYAAIDAHPVLRKAELVTSRSGRTGLLATRLSDVASFRSTDRPLSILSSSQANAFAISLFLSMNLGLETPPLESAILDDPLQSLDNIHLLGVVDVLRRVASRRQLIVSTHDAAFAALLSRKLRPIRGSSSSSAVLVTLGVWDEEGTLVTVEHVEPQATPLKLVS